MNGAHAASDIERANEAIDEIRRDIVAIRKDTAMLVDRLLSKSSCHTDPNDVENEVESEPSIDPYEKLAREKADAALAAAEEIGCGRHFDYLKHVEQEAQRLREFCKSGKLTIYLNEDSLLRLTQYAMDTERIPSDVAEDAVCDFLDERI